MFSAIIEVKGSEPEIKAYFEALLPEQDFKTERAGYKLKKVKNKLIIEINASDATAFRAVSNSITGLISIVDKSLKAINNGK
jgi:tRNA threonylcarbamoyladenosine modification (KEOPS) complex  Pcc1 subunit